LVLGDPGSTPQRLARIGAGMVQRDPVDRALTAEGRDQRRARCEPRATGVAFGDLPDRDDVDRVDREDAGGGPQLPAGPYRRAPPAPEGKRDAPSDDLVEHLALEQHSQCPAATLSAAINAMPPRNGR